MTLDHDSKTPTQTGSESKGKGTQRPEKSHCFTAALLQLTTQVVSTSVCWNKWVQTIFYHSSRHIYKLCCRRAHMQQMLQLLPPNCRSACIPALITFPATPTTQQRQLWPRQNVYKCFKATFTDNKNYEPINKQRVKTRAKKTGSLNVSGKVIDKNTEAVCQDLAQSLAVLALFCQDLFGACFFNQCKKEKSDIKCNMRGGTEEL